MTPTAPLFSFSCSLSLLSFSALPMGALLHCPSPVPSPHLLCWSLPLSHFLHCWLFSGPLSCPVWSPCFCLSDFPSLVPMGCSCPSLGRWLSWSLNSPHLFLTLLGHTGAPVHSLFSPQSGRPLQAHRLHWHICQGKGDLEADCASLGPGTFPGVTGWALGCGLR